jgi:hypothetical protein
MVAAMGRSQKSLISACEAIPGISTVGMPAEAIVRLDRARSDVLFA